MTEDYRNKVIIVTGASAGIGKELSLALLRKGGRVVACARHLENLGSLEEAWERNEGELLTAGCDVSQPQDVQRLVDSALQRFGTIDGLVNNAGIYPCTPFLELSEPEWDQVQGTNLKGPFLCSQAVAGAMISQGLRGSIVNVSSTASLLARPGVAHYASSKAGLNMLTKSLALELAPNGIRVNAVLPGFILTERVQRQLNDQEALVEHRAKLARIPLKQEGDPQDIVHAVLYFLSEAARYTTGSLLIVDGGYSLGIPAYDTAQ
jgi:NAD(P)-dependent dehydrogenase (short-subunit alcohol dehydrogenase family)